MINLDALCGGSDGKDVGGGRGGGQGGPKSYHLLMLGWLVFEMRFDLHHFQKMFCIISAIFSVFRRFASFQQDFRPRFASINSTESKSSFFRLDFDKDTTRKTSLTYVSYRILQLITAIIWIAFGVFFRIRIRQTISNICPLGKLSAIGGNRRRNIITLGNKI